ncbi:MAG: hypothetical protein K0A94_02655 [Desulfuromonadales bacterium]|nr:hypothetical protein [Desulfuromonadales bacterium]
MNHRTGVLNLVVSVICWLLWGPGVLTPVQAAERILLASNDQVLVAWQEGQQGGPTPQLVAQEDGGTVIQWQGNVSYDFYRRESRGGHLVTPYGTGNFYQGRLASDVRALHPRGSVSYLQFSGRYTDDPSVLSKAVGGQLDTLQFGHVGTGYQVAFGDVAANFSTLGTSLGLRGVLAQTLLGKTTVSATAGYLSQDWETLVDSSKRTQYLRQAYALKIETPVHDNLRVFISGQGYRDDSDSIDAGLTLLPTASTQAGTVGFAFDLGRFAVQAEGGASRFREKGGESETDHALIVDVGWLFDALALRAGYRDIGLYYNSLSTQGGNGIEEIYLNGNWRAASWLSVNADLRRAENEIAGFGGSSSFSETNALATSAVITFGPDFSAWSLMLNQSLSDGENSNGSTNRNQTYGAVVSYADSNWNSGLGYQLLDVKNRGSYSSDSQIDSWQFHLSRTWQGYRETVPSWHLTPTLTVNYQDQKLDIGNGSSTLNWQLGLSGERARWGSFAAGYGEGRTTQTGRSDLRQQNWQIEVGYPLWKEALLKAYYSGNRVSGSEPGQGANYREQTFGLHFACNL